MAKDTEFSNKLEGYRKMLTNQEVRLKSYGKYGLFAGLAIVAIALILVCYIVYLSPCCFWWPSFWPYAVAILSVFASIFCFMGYKNCVAEMSELIKEQIVLRDLEIVIDLIRDLPDEDTKNGDDTHKRDSHKSKLLDQIIQTLLQRCN